MFFYSRKNKRAVQMLAAAALVTTVTVPYVVDVETVAASTTKENVDFLFTAGDDFETGHAMDSYFKTNFIKDVALEFDAQGKPYAYIQFTGHAYAIESFQVDGQDVEIVETAGAAGTKEQVRTARVALDDNYQVKVTYGSKDHGEGSFLFDLGTEDADYELTTGGNEAYFSQWIQGADVLTKADGSKVAHITFIGHSYAAAISGDLISSTGSVEEENLVRTVRVPVDADNKASVTLTSGERGSYTFSFDFTEKEAVKTITTATDVTAEKQAVDFNITASMPDMFIVPGIMTTKQVHTADGKVVFTMAVAKNESARGAYNSLTVKQGETTLATWAATDGDTDITFSVDKVENIHFETGYVATGSTDITTYKGTLNDVTFAKAVADEDNKDETDKEDDVVAPTTPSDVIPADTVRGLRADYTFAPDVSRIQSAQLAEFLKTYFHKGFFSDAIIVTIDGKTYADLGLIYKSAGFDPIEYKTADGTFKPVNVIEHNGKESEAFAGKLRVPVTVEDGQYKATIKTTGSQPGAETASSYTFDFAFKPAQNKFTDVTANAEEIQTLYLHNITNGKSDTTFAPNGEMKRYEFAVMIARALGLEATTATKFKDIEGKWYADSVQALYEANIISGVNETTFNPNGTVSRQQAAKMIGGMLEYLDYKPSATLEDLNFKDEDKIADYAKLHIAELQKQGIMTGSNELVNPTGALKRGQMAKILTRSLNLVNFFE